MKRRLAITFAFVMLSLACAAQHSSKIGELAPRQTPVQVGEMAPDFTLEDQQRQKVTLSAMRGQAPVVLVFYRGNW